MDLTALQDDENMYISRIEATTIRSSSFEHIFTAESQPKKWQSGDDCCAVGVRETDHPHNLANRECLKVKLYSCAKSC